MTLLDVVRELHRLDEELTLYVKKPWTPESEARVEPEPEDALMPPALEREGFAYFLEVFLAKDVVPPLTEEQPASALQSWCKRLIEYADRDA